MAQNVASLVIYTFGDALCNNLQKNKQAKQQTANQRILKKTKQQEEEKNTWPRHTKQTRTFSFLFLTLRVLRRQYWIKAFWEQDKGT